MIRITDLIKKVKNELAGVNKQLGLDIEFIHGGERSGTKKHLVLGKHIHENIEGSARELLRWAEGVRFGAYEQECRDQNRILKFRFENESLEKKVKQLEADIDQERDFRERVRSDLTWELQKELGHVKIREEQINKIHQEKAKDEEESKASALAMMAKMNQNFGPKLSYGWDDHDGKIAILRRKKTDHKTETAVLARCKDWGRANAFIRGHAKAFYVAECV